MLVDRGERRQIESPADFFQARRVAVLLDEFVEVVQNLALTFRERLHGSLRRVRGEQTAKPCGLRP